MNRSLQRHVEVRNELNNDVKFEANKYQTLNILQGT